MKNPVLDKIKNNAVKILNDTYGYCGIADGGDIAILNSGNGDDTIVITIKNEKQTES